MATIFLSYRRTDSPQACRVYDWLTQRFGHDAVFMDVEAIPVAVSFPDFIQQAIADSKILIALIGAEWQKKIHDADDPVRAEIEAALANRITVLPVLIGNTPMPDAERMPASIASIASQNAVVVGVSHDFHTHMQSLLPKIESILGALARQRVAISDPDVIYSACEGIIGFLRESPKPRNIDRFDWKVLGGHEFSKTELYYGVTLLLHRVVRLAELLELHFILSLWAQDASMEHRLAGWIIRQLEQTPVIPREAIAPYAMASEWDLKVRASDEDARQIWKMITDRPLRLSLAYVATVSPRARIESATPTEP